MQLAGANAQHTLLHCLPAAFKPPWRNWLARSAVNRKVGGSSPPGGGKTHFGDTIVLTELAMSQHLQPRKDLYKCGSNCIIRESEPGPHAWQASILPLSQ